MMNRAGRLKSLDRKAPWINSKSAGVGVNDLTARDGATNGRPLVSA